MRLERTLATLEEGIRLGLHLGGQLYVSVDGLPVADLAFGEARPGEAMSKEHLMLWLSASKPIGAVAIAQLWQVGKLALDDRIAQHIPGFGTRGKEAITLRHLLTHTGGFRLLRVGWPEKSWEEIIEWICVSPLEPRWQPGRTAGYHLSSSWFVLGELVRRLDGRTFDRYVREEIFGPLGMTDCWIGMPAERYGAYGRRLAPVYGTESSPPVSHDWEAEVRVTRTSPGANGWGPLRQLGRFYEMLLAGGWAGDVSLLRPQTVEALVARHRVGILDKTFREKLDWGLGFVLESAHYGAESVPYSYGPYASSRTFGHSGYRSTTAFADPAHGLVAAVAVNGTPDEETHRRRFEAIDAAIYRDLGLAPDPDEPDQGSR